MRTLTYLVPLLCLTAPMALAQSTFKPGYVVPPSGDTLRGELNDRYAQRNTHTILFRATPQSASTQYRPSELQAYGLRDGAAYEVRYVAKDSAATEPLFLEVLERGPVRLYFATDASGRNAFYAAKATGPAVLLEKKVETVVLNTEQSSGQKVLREQNLYRAKLAELMGDCSDMGLYIAQLPFGEKALRQAVQRYASCRGTKKAVAVTQQRRALQIGVTVGGGLSQLKMNTEAYKDNGNELVMTGGLSLALPFGHRSTQLSFISGLLYEKGSYLTEGRVPSFSGRLVKREYATDATFLRVPLGVRYEFTSGAVQPFAQLGFTAGYVLKAETDFRDESFITPGLYSDWKKLEFAQRKLEQAVFGGVGVQTNRPGRHTMQAVLQADVSNGFSEVSGFGTSFRRFYLLLTYNLTKQR